MTIDEFENAVASALQNRKMELWERIDLLIILRFAKRRGFVVGSDLLILKWSGNRNFDNRLPENWKQVEPKPEQKKLF